MEALLFGGEKSQEVLLVILRRKLFHQPSVIIKLANQALDTFRDHHGKSFPRSPSVTIFGLALPLEAFMTWPVRKLRSFSLPP